MAVQAHATAKYVRTSAQKAGLVLDLIRGRDVNHGEEALSCQLPVSRFEEKLLEAGRWKLEAINESQRI